MVRAPCCEKMGLKKGPWSPEEDQILITYIHTHGHSNWRALPKQAGLLRCGKSCRLRWTNYLRPDIKRGNFTREEEDTIIKLHETLGNRWSAIAARLPGRTDNEIKNVWHTHLKKRLSQNHHKQRNPNQIHSNSKQHHLVSDDPHVKTRHYAPPSPPQCSTASDVSTISNTTDIHNEHNSCVTPTNDISTSETENNNIVEELDEDFWSTVLSADHKDLHFPFQFSPVPTTAAATSIMCDCFSMDFWYNVYSGAEELLEL